MALRQLQIDVDPDQPLPDAIEHWLGACQARIDLYWDSFKEKPLPQYIECDFRVVAKAIESCVQNDWLDGRLFVEWGCGFGVVAGVAAAFGLDAIGIEAEEFLCDEARKLLAKSNLPAEIWQGNFLPGGARRLAEDTDPLISLSHDEPPAYAKYDMSIEDFAMVYVYPWPGEEHFLRLVFDRYARSGAVLLFYRGPYHVEVYRKS